MSNLMNFQDEMVQLLLIKKEALIEAKTTALRLRYLTKKNPNLLARVVHEIMSNPYSHRFKY